MATASIYNDSASQTSWKKWTKYFSFPISTINSALNNTANVPANATITNVKVNVKARYECSASAIVYFSFGIGGNGSISKTLLSSNQIGSQAMSNYETQSANLPIGSSVSPFSISTADGSYFTIRINTDNIMPKTFWVDSVTLDITYHTHSYTSTVTTQPTCTTTGVRTYTCSCGHSYTESIAKDPNNHAGGTEIKNAKAATCTAEGYTGDTYCKGCGAKLSSGTTIAKIAHTEVKLPAVAPTCTTTGLTEGKKCSVCGAIITAQQPVAALGHDYSIEKVVDPTSTANGYTEHTCSRCGDSFKDTYTCQVYGTNSPLNTGSVRIDGGSNKKIVNLGDEVTLTASGHSGYTFKQWDDGNTDNPRTVTVTNSITYTAVFEEAIYPPVYIGNYRCKDIFIDEENKKTLFKSDNMTIQRSDKIDTVDGWHFEKIWGLEPAGVKRVKKIYIGTRQIY